MLPDVERVLQERNARAQRRWGLFLEEHPERTEQERAMLTMGAFYELDLL